MAEIELYYEDYKLGDVRTTLGRTITETDNVFYSHLIRWSQFQHVSSYFNLNNYQDSLEENLIAELLETLPVGFRSCSLDRIAQLVEIETLLHGYLLSSQGDRMSMAHSVEGRYPFLGKKFVKDMAEIADYRKTIGVRSKDLFRDAMKGLLPPEIVFRPKVAYQAPEAKSFLSASYMTEEAKFLKEK